MRRRKSVKVDETSDGITVHTESGKDYRGAALIRRRRLVVDHPADGGRRRPAETRRPYHLSGRAADLGNAGAIPLARHGAVGGREGASGALSAAHRRIVQSRRRIPFQPLRGGLGQFLGDPAELHERFAKTCEPVRTLLNKIESWRMWVLCDRPPIKDWSRGRITLVGDAAHPMLQYLAQGAGMSIERGVPGR